MQRATSQHLRMFDTTFYGLAQPCMWIINICKGRCVRCKEMTILMVPWQQLGWWLLSRHFKGLTVDCKWYPDRLLTIMTSEHDLTPDDLLTEDLSQMQMKINNPNPEGDENTTVINVCLTA